MFFLSEFDRAVLLYWTSCQLSIVIHTLNFGKEIKEDDMTLEWENQSTSTLLD